MSRRPTAAAVALCTGVALAVPALVSSTSASAAPPPAAAGSCPEPAQLEFAEPTYVDTARAGGEPLVFTDPSGRLMYSSHAGSTHFYTPQAANPGSSAFVENYQGQTYIWTSDDDGKTWEFVERILPPQGVANSGFSDPEFAFDAAGNQFFSEINLANIAVSKSSDKGSTWTLQNVAGAVLTDRQWMEADREDELYFVANAFGGGSGTPPGNNLGHYISKSTDGGQTFTKLPTQEEDRYVMFIDDAIRACLPLLFPEYTEFEAHAVKVSRDAELDIEEDVSANLMSKIKKGLKKREIGTPSRLLYDPETPQSLLGAIMAHTGITEEELVEGSKYHNFRDFFGFPDFNLPELKYKPQPALPHPLLEKEPSIIAAMQKQDYMVHYPYQSFEYVIKLFNEAAKDPKVTAISATLYRVADGSEIAKALTKAAKNGKLVTVVVELKARFDEESNMYWAGKLQKAGANVILGVPDLKVHSKLGLITRNENGKLVNYAYLSTGNYNEDTSKIYADHALFTCDKRLTRDVEQVFNFFIDRQPDKKFKHLLVAPINMRERFTDLVNHEIKNAKHGLPASIILKMNALQDDKMIRKLYDASQAGVKIELIVRGICCLQPGIKGLSENITVHSIVDRYLEHSRVYIFHNNGNEKYYIASADWMTRNLSRRVEVAIPLFQQDLIDQVRTIIDLQRSDDTKARLVDNKYVERSTDDHIRSQYATYDFLQGLLK